MSLIPNSSNDKITWMIINYNLPDYEICFCILGYQGEPSQYFSICPIAYLGPEGRGGFVRVDIKLVVGRSQIVIEEHLDVCYFADLLRVLIESQNHINASAILFTADGLLELSLKWRESSQDILFVGKTPSFEYTEILENPLLLRDNVYRWQTFQFAMEPQKAFPVILKLQAFLELIEMLNNNWGRQFTETNRGHPWVVF